MSQRRYKWPSMTIKCGKTGHLILLMRTTRICSKGLNVRTLNCSGLCSSPSRSSRRIHSEAFSRKLPPKLPSRQQLQRDPLRSWTSKNIDEDAEAILLAAAERIEGVLKDKNHYFHRGEDVQGHKAPLIQQKKELVQHLLASPLQNGHQWAPFRTGVACKKCKHKF